MFKTTKSLVSLLLIVIAGLLILSVSSQRQLTKLKNNPQQIAQEEAKKLVSQVSELIVLPEGEIPTVATITDVEKLQKQAFFARAKNGDKVLIFTSAKRAILYDPIENKIVEVAPINIGDNAPARTSAPADSTEGSDSGN